MSRIKESVQSIIETIAVCLKNNLTFAAYRMPELAEQNLIIQKNPEIKYIENLSNISSLKGFLVSPFLQSAKNRTFLIQPDFYFKGNVSDKDSGSLGETIKSLKINLDFTHPNEVSKTEFLQQVESIKEAIKENKIQKAVLSRVKIVEGNFEKQLPELFSKLCKSFPNAFVYLFKADGHFWMGATPEPFALLKNNTFQTSSVAGTRENTEKFLQFENWQNKERQEQQYVSDHIRRILKAANLPNIFHHGPYVKKAGNMVHLRTDFTTNINSVNGNIGYLLERLHPTPAVCGYPTKEALKIIESIEKHDREYYGGFLGPLGLEDTISLFVNLRCMRISESFLSLFTGAGITLDSIPDDEWEETEMKAGTLLSAINTLN